jgi:uncharacterized protein YndB with AHSA1/START domain
VPSSTKSIILSAAPERVWETVTDIDLFDSWMADHAGFVGETPSELAPGATFIEEVRIMGMPAQVTWKVTELAPAKRLVLEGTGPMGTTARAGLDLQPAGSGASLTFTSAVEGEVTVPFAGTIQQELDKNVTQSLEKLRGLLQA